jgi:TolB-like protein/Flp pilus assembly protein TadD
MSLIAELKRRNVFRVGVAYAIVAWLLVEVASVVLPTFEAPEWVMKVLTFLVILGFPLATILAWAFELTPEGIKRETDVDHAESSTQQTSRKLDYAIIGLLAFAVVFMFVDNYVLKTVPESAEKATDQAPAIERVQREKSIAVLPFVNMSDDPANEYFSDGISEELLNVLVRVDGLRVPSRTSSFAFKGTNTDIREIAQRLKVGHILEGSVRKAGNRVRITAQLIDVSTDTHLWSNTYERELEDIFAIQDQISQEIIREMQIALGASGLLARDESRPTEDMQAYQEYLRGRHLFMQRGVNSLKTSLEALQSAVVRDPDFAEAWAALSQTATTLSGWEMKNFNETNKIALEAGNRALQLDENSSAAMAGLGLAYFNMGNWTRALELLEQSASLSRDSTPVYWFGLVLQAAGYFEEAREKLQEAEHLDPVYPQLQYWIGLNSIMLGDTDKARVRFQRTADGRNPNGPNAMLWVDLLEGETKRAAERMRELGAMRDAGTLVWISPESERDITAALEDPALRDDAIRAAQDEESSWFLGWLGAYPQIMDYLGEQLMEARVLNIVIDLGRSLWAPNFKTLRQMPEFKRLLMEIGLVDLWKSRGWPDLCRPLSDGDFECD